MIMKRSQISSAFLYGLLVVMGIAVVSFGFAGIRHLGEANKDAQLSNFVLSMQNKITVSRLKPNSIQEEIFSLPQDIDTVCFVDTKKNFRPFVNKELDEIKAAYGQHNLFLSPFGSYPAHRLEYLDLDKNPLCLKVIDGKLRVTFEGDGNYTRVNGAERRSDECVSIIYNQEPGESIDIVFLGYGYSDTGTFSKEVNEYINEVFFEMEPFRSSKDKINFYRVDDFSLECSLGSYVSCEDYKTKILASNCPHDYIIVIVDRSKLADTLSPVRSSALANIAKINTADNRFVIMHELGHTFGGLADEYVDKYYENMGFKADEYPNCDTQGCNKWYGKESTGCFGGCSTNAYFRSSETSIMKELKVHDYGALNKEIIKKKIDAYE